MGLINSTESSKIVSIVKGKFTIRLPDDSDNPSAVTRTLEQGVNAGKEIKELQYKAIEGNYVTSYVDEGEYGTNYITELRDDEGDSFKLRINLDSQFFSQYAKRMPNIKKDVPIFFGLGYDKEKEKNFLFIRQQGVNVPFAYTRDNPNGLPPPEEKEVRGKKVWNWEAQEQFLYDVAMDFSDNQSGKDLIIETFNAVEKEEIPF